MFAYFAEHAVRIKHEAGRVGLVVPTGIVLDDATKRFTQEIFAQGQVSSVYHFNNTESIFPNVHNSYSFVLLTLGKAQKADCVFYATNPIQLEDEKRHLSFEPNDVALMNPNTQTLLLVRSEYDLELCRKLYKAAPVLIKDGAETVNLWHVQNMRMFDMANDSDLFEALDREQAASALEHGLVPLYEGKLFWQFDHRFASFGYSEQRSLLDCEQGSLLDVHDVDITLKRDRTFRIIPRYWVRHEHVAVRMAEKGWTKSWVLALRNLASTTNERTLIVSVLPASYALGHSATLVMPDFSDKKAACFLALLNSMVVDYVLRIKQSGTNVSLFFVKQLPILPPESFAPAGGRVPQNDVQFHSTSHG